jgi:hypothetical protein
MAKQHYYISLHKNKTLDDLKDYEVVQLAPFQNHNRPLQVEINATSEEIKKGMNDAIIKYANLKENYHLTT